MTNITINNKNHTLVLAKGFAERAKAFGSYEYEELKRAKQDNPNYRIVVRRRTTKKDGFKGLNYEFMEMYITIHNKDLLDEFYTRIGKKTNEDGTKIEAGHYTEVKKWFLDNFPEIEDSANGTSDGSLVA